jgi:hypothetical protein
MPVKNSALGYCLHHARQFQAIPVSESDPADALASVGDLDSFDDINHALGKIFKLLAADRITPRNAAVLAYICQLSLISLPRPVGVGISPALEKIVAHFVSASGSQTAGASHNSGQSG